MREEDDLGEYKLWRVTSRKADALCPSIFEVVRKQDWRIAELRPAPRTLEAVFRELAEHAEVER